MAFDYKYLIPGYPMVGALQELGKFFGGGKDEDYGLGNIPEEIKKYFQPSIEAGGRALPQLEETYGQMVHDPGQLYSELGKGFKESPGYQYRLQEALRAGSAKANAGGMGGSPAYQKWAMGTATNLANQDFENYMNKILELHGGGTKGLHDIYQTGTQTGTQYGTDVANIRGTQAQLKAAQDMAQRKMWMDILGKIMGAGTSALVGGGGL